MKKRITSIVGAGAILDFDMKEGTTFPSTKNITEAVVGIEVINFKDKRDRSVSRSGVRVQVELRMSA